MNYALGIDIGGTFTDVLLASETGITFRAKVLTTPHDLVQGCRDGVAKALALAGVRGEDVARAVHATTQGTNTITERRVPPVPLLVTAGFRDLIAVSGTRGGSRDTFDLLWEPWQPPTERRLTYEVPERMGAGGDVVRPLDDNAVREVARELRDEGVAGVAVCLLHSYASPQHELRVREILYEELGPDVYIATSAEVWPEYMEMQRCFATLFTAYIGPVMRNYLQRLEEGLLALGIKAELQVMQSSGGVMSVRRTMARPLLSVESGPTAAVLAAAHVGKLGGYDKLIAFDMGGTTAKAALVEGGKPKRRQEFEIGGSVAGGGEESGGVVLRIPSIDLAEVGAGGGSIAWIDEGGLLQVGPRSAAATPGPACYDLGGLEPTVTDANLVLGYLSPEYFLGGAMPLNASAAETAVGTLALKLDIGVRDTAAAIHDIANQTMANAVRLVTVARGADPADYVLIAFGGAGPMHGARVAEAFGISDVVIPKLPGVFSTVGLVTSDMELEQISPVWALVDDISAEFLEGQFREIEGPLYEELHRSGFSYKDIRRERSLDMRYRSQGFDLSIPVEPGFTPGRIADEFAKRYQEEYGVERHGVPVVVRACRARVLAPGGRIAWRQESGGRAPLHKAEKGRRRSYFPELGDYRETTVYDRDLLQSDMILPGPAIIEEPESTIIVPPSWVAELDSSANVRLRRRSMDS